MTPKAGLGVETRSVGNAGRQAQTQIQPTNMDIPQFRPLETHILAMLSQDKQTMSLEKTPQRLSFGKPAITILGVTLNLVRGNQMKAV